MYHIASKKSWTVYCDEKQSSPLTDAKFTFYQSSRFILKVLELRVSKVNAKNKISDNKDENV